MARKYDSPCPVARTLNVIGDRWAILILRDFFLARDGERARSRRRTRAASVVQRSKYLVHANVQLDVDRGLHIAARVVQPATLRRLQSESGERRGFNATARTLQASGAFLTERLGSTAI